MQNKERAALPYVSADRKPSVPNRRGQLCTDTYHSDSFLQIASY
jgi:hypothetical protein